MPHGPLNGPRPAASSTLKLVIRETPVPEKDPTPVFPMNIIRADNTTQAILEDMEARMEFDIDRFSIDRTSSFTRGMGQTDVWEIMVDVSGLSPRAVDDMVETFVNAGYLFDNTEFQ